MEGDALKVAKNGKTESHQSYALCNVQVLVARAPGILAVLAGPGRPRSEMLTRSLLGSPG